MAGWPGEGRCRLMAHRMAHAKRAGTLTNAAIRAELATLDARTADVVREWLNRWGVYAL